MKRISLNKSDYKLIGVYLLIVTTWLIYRFTVEAYTRLEFMIDIPVALLQVVVLLSVLKGLVEYYFLNNGHVVVFILLGFVSLWVVGFITMLSGDFTLYRSIPWERYTPIGNLIINNVSNSIYNIAIPVLLLSGKKYHEYRLNEVKLINAQKELEVKLLRAQYDPHFLYNSLNTIDALIDYSSKEKVKTYIAHLSALYRYLIHTIDEEVVSLEKELQLANNYIYLIDTQFENDYEFKIIGEATKDNYLPNGTLLAVLENVVKHNKAIQGKAIITEVHVNEHSVVVTNTKMESTTKSDRQGTGLQNLDKRYRLVSDSKIKIEETVGRFTIHLPLLKVIK
ncbi:MAG: sensor histidine kinase [Thermonemataceae bacterium]